MREAAWEARMGEPDTVVGVTLGADTDGRTATRQRLCVEVVDYTIEGVAGRYVDDERLSWRAPTAKRRRMT